MAPCLAMLRAVARHTGLVGDQPDQIHSLSQSYDRPSGQVQLHCGPPLRPQEKEALQILATFPVMHASVRHPLGRDIFGSDRVLFCCVGVIAVLSGVHPLPLWGGAGGGGSGGGGRAGSPPLLGNEPPHPLGGVPVLGCGSKGDLARAISRDLHGSWLMAKRNVVTQIKLMVTHLMWDPKQLSSPLNTGF